MNTKYRNMTKAELIKTIEALDSTLRVPSEPSAIPSQTHLLHELQAHQVELEAQNQELSDAHQLLEESRNRYADLYDLSPIGYVTLNRKGLIQEINLTGATMLGVERSRLIGLPLGLFVIREDMHIFHAHLRRCAEATGPSQSEFRLTRKDAVVFWAEFYTVSSPREKQQAPLFFTAMTDITARKQVEEQLRHLNAHDPLTGLYNRAYFEGEMARLQAGRQFPISVVMADLDNLKQVNDRHGHAQGDKFLQQAAQIFREVFRIDDVVARIGGDEFAALLPSTNGATAQAIVRRIRADLVALNAKGCTPALSLSLGAATANKGEPVLQALNQADERMYREKTLKPLHRGSEANDAALSSGSAGR